jgi:hypothetical protein
MRHACSKERPEESMATGPIVATAPADPYLLDAAEIVNRMIGRI